MIETTKDEPGNPTCVDMLRTIFRSQARFQARVEEKAGSVSIKQWHAAMDDDETGAAPGLDEGEIRVVEANVQRHTLCLMMEAAELMDWTRWKHWSSRLGNKRNIYPGSAEHVTEMRVEVADLLCFLVNVSMALGMDADELFAQYMLKAGINHDRQDVGGY